MKLIVMGAGYVGEALLKYLQSKPYEIFITTTRQERVEDLKVYGQSVLLLHPGENQAVKKLIDTCDGMIILIAPKNSHSYEETYLTTAQQISSALKGRKTPFHLLYTSSTSVYEGLPGWVTENSQLSPHSENAKTLLKAEEHYLKAEVKTCVLRLGGIYGPNRELIDRAQRLSGKELAGSGNESTNHSHLDDIVKALMFCLEHSLTGIYNMVNDDHPTRKELYSALCRSIDSPSPIWNAGPSQTSYKVSNQKIKDAGFIFQHLFIQT